MGGDWQNFRRMGGPPSPPPGKKPWAGMDMVSLLYDSATEQWIGFVQSFKSYYMQLLYVIHMSGFFYRYVNMEKRSWRQP